MLACSRGQPKVTPSCPLSGGNERRLVGRSRERFEEGAEEEEGEEVVVDNTH